MLPSKPPAIPAASAEVSAEFTRWLAYLSLERRMSPKTVEAYRRDARQLLLFLSEHLGGRVSLSALSRLKPPDVRAFMARRRGEGVSNASLTRIIAGVRSFARFLERQGKGSLGALRAVRAPKSAR